MRWSSDFYRIECLLFATDPVDGDRPTMDLRGTDRVPGVPSQVDDPSIRPLSLGTPPPPPEAQISQDDAWHAFPLPSGAAWRVFA